MTACKRQSFFIHKSCGSYKPPELTARITGNRREEKKPFAMRLQKWIPYIRKRRLERRISVKKLLFFTVKMRVFSRVSGVFSPSVKLKNNPSVKHAYMFDEGMHACYDSVED